MNASTESRLGAWVAVWGLLGVLAAVLLWNVLGENSRTDALAEVPDEVLEPEIPIHRASSPLPTAHDASTSDTRESDIIEDYAIADRLSGRNVAWREARWRRKGSQQAVPVVLKPVGEGSLQLSAKRATDLRSGLATLEIHGSDKSGEDIWTGTIDSDENIVWVDAFAELRVHVDGTQLVNVRRSIAPKVRVLLRPEVPRDLTFRKPILRGKMITDRLAPDSFRRWAKQRGLMPRDFRESRRLDLGEGKSRNESFFVPLNCNVWILISGTRSWSPVVKTATLRRGETTHMVIPLSAPLTVSGRVLNTSNEPVPRALARCTVVTDVPDSEEGFPYTQDDARTFFGAVRRAGASSSIVTLSQTLETDAEGRFTATFPITDTVVCYCIREEDSAVKVVELGSRDAEPPFITLRLSAKPSHLRLLDAKGDPLANTSIKFVDTEPRVRLQINYPPVDTDADGWLEGAHFLEPGVRYWIHPTGKMRRKQTFTYHRGATVVLPD